MARKKEQAEAPVKKTTAKRTTGTAKGKTTTGSSKAKGKGTGAKDVKPETEATTDGTATGKKKEPKLPSRAKVTMQKLLDLSKQYAAKNEKLSHRIVLKHLGGSLGTIGRLMRQLELLKRGDIGMEAVLSQATEEAIKEDISRHLELYRDRLIEREELIADVTADIERIITVFDGLHNDLVD